LQKAGIETRQVLDPACLRQPSIPNYADQINQPDIFGAWRTGWRRQCPGAWQARTNTGDLSRKRLRSIGRVDRVGLRRHRAPAIVIRMLPHEDVGCFEIAMRELTGVKLADEPGYLVGATTKSRSAFRPGKIGQAREVAVQIDRVLDLFGQEISFVRK